MYLTKVFGIFGFQRSYGLQLTDSLLKTSLFNCPGAKRRGLGDPSPVWSFLIQNMGALINKNLLELFVTHRALKRSPRCKLRAINLICSCQKGFSHIKLLDNFERLSWQKQTHSCSLQTKMQVKNISTVGIIPSTACFCNVWQSLVD